MQRQASAEHKRHQGVMMYARSSRRCHCFLAHSFCGTYLPKMMPIVRLSFPSGTYNRVKEWVLRSTHKTSSKEQQCRNKHSRRTAQHCWKHQRWMPWWVLRCCILQSSHSTSLSQPVSQYPWTHLHNIQQSPRLKLMMVQVQVEIDLDCFDTFKYTHCVAASYHNSFC